MIFTDKYTLEYDPRKDAHRVHSTEAPLCPSCGFLMSGDDNRRRKAIDSTGAVYWLLVRRLYCPKCKTHHTELPRSLVPFKQYEAAVIEDAGSPQSSCPAEGSTIRRWKRK